MSDVKTPVGLSCGGRSLWRAITDVHDDLDAVQLVQLEEAARAKDRLDKLDAILRADVDTWATLVHDVRTEDYELKIDAALSQANSTANLLKQLLAALRLPDAATGRKPQARPPRGAHAPKVPTKVSSLERARAAKSS